MAASLQQPSSFQQINDTIKAIRENGRILDNAVMTEAPNSPEIEQARIQQYLLLNRLFRMVFKRMQSIEKRLKTRDNAIQTHPYLKYNLLNGHSTSKVPGHDGIFTTDKYEITHKCHISPIQTVELEAHGAIERPIKYIAYSSTAYAEWGKKRRLIGDAPRHVLPSNWYPFLTITRSVQEYMHNHALGIGCYTVTKEKLRELQEARNWDLKNVNKQLKKEFFLMGKILHHMLNVDTYTEFHTNGNPVHAERNDNDDDIINYSNNINVSDGEVSEEEHANESEMGNDRIFYTIKVDFSKSPLVFYNSTNDRSTSFLDGYAELKFYQKKLDSLTQQYDSDIANAISTISSMYSAQFTVHAPVIKRHTHKQKVEEIKDDIHIFHELQTKYAVDGILNMTSVKKDGANYEINKFHINKDTVISTNSESNTRVVLTRKFNPDVLFVLMYHVFSPMISQYYGDAFQQDIKLDPNMSLEEFEEKNKLLVSLSKQDDTVVLSIRLKHNNTETTSSIILPYTNMKRGVEWLDELRANAHNSYKKSNKRILNKHTYTNLIRYSGDKTSFLYNDRAYINDMHADYDIMIPSWFALMLYNMKQMYGPVSVDQLNDQNEEENAEEEGEAYVDSALSDLEYEKNLELENINEMIMNSAMCDMYSAKDNIQNNNPHNSLLACTEDNKHDTSNFLGVKRKEAHGAREPAYFYDIEEYQNDEHFQQFWDKTSWFEGEYWLSNQGSMHAAFEEKIKIYTTFTPGSTMEKFPTMARPTNSPAVRSWDWFLEFLTITRNDINDRLIDYVEENPENTHWLDIRPIIGFGMAPRKGVFRAYLRAHGEETRAKYSAMWLKYIPHIVYAYEGCGINPFVAIKTSSKFDEPKTVFWWQDYRVFMKKSKFGMYGKDLVFPDKMVWEHMQKKWYGKELNIVGPVVIIYNFVYDDLKEVLKQEMNNEAEIHAQILDDCLHLIDYIIFAVLFGNPFISAPFFFFFVKSITEYRMSSDDVTESHNAFFQKNMTEQKYSEFLKEYKCELLDKYIYNSGQYRQAYDTFFLYVYPERQFNIKHYFPSASYLERKFYNFSMHERFTNPNTKEDYILLLAEKDLTMMNEEEFQNATYVSKEDYINVCRKIWGDEQVDDEIERVVEKYDRIQNSRHQRHTFLPVHRYQPTPQPSNTRQQQNRNTRQQQPQQQNRNTRQQQPQQQNRNTRQQQPQQQNRNTRQQQPRQQHRNTRQQQPQPQRRTPRQPQPQDFIVHTAKPRNKKKK